MKQSPSPSILILGKGEIARCLAELAARLHDSVMVCEPDASKFAWPQNVVIKETVFSDAPWPLAPHTHAVIARGHEGDVQSVASLLNQDVSHVYLIASAKRAQNVIADVEPMLADPTTLTRLSAPAGLDIGGNSSMEIALSILAEIQLRHYQKTGHPLTSLREDNSHEDTARKDKARSNLLCPGKRP